MLRIDIISAVPDLLHSPLDHSIIRIARDKKRVDIRVHDLREYSDDKHRKVDDYPYGGGAGMVLTPQPLFDCIETLAGERDYEEIIFPTPDAPVFNQQQANRLSLSKNLMIVCGHYKGIDERVRKCLITKEISIGDYVLSGGELPALVITDALVRLQPGVLGDAESALDDSFQHDLLSPPLYTRPADFRGMKVPGVLQQGDHKKIAEWRRHQAEHKTRECRPDLYQKFIND